MKTAELPKMIKVPALGVPDKESVMSVHRAVATRDFLRRLPARDQAQAQLLEQLDQALAQEGGSK